MCAASNHQDNLDFPGCNTAFKTQPVVPTGKLLFMHTDGQLLKTLSAA